MTSFGGICKMSRDIRQVSLEYVGKIVGVQKGYLSNIEHGKVAPPSPAITRKLAGFYGLNRDGMVALSIAEKAPKGIVRTLFIKAVFHNWPDLG